jgi:4'-phosphopantetheinyl transferase
MPITGPEFSGPVTPLSVTQLRQLLPTLPGKLPERQQLDVWLLSTKMTDDERESHWSTLSPDEQERAGRFLFDADRDRSIAARGGLRLILSAYSGVRPADFVFKTGSHGKPSLFGAGIPLEFNVSHSGDCVLVGVTLESPCGVDIEGSRSTHSELAIAERFFGSRELEWLKQTEGGFLRLWTAKEAIIKAVGRGLSIPLSDVDVTDVVAGRASSIALETSGIERRTIWVDELALVQGYAAAVAVDGDRHSIRLFSEAAN